MADLSIEACSGALAVPEQFVWVGLHEPGEALLRQVQQEFGLHELAIEDALRAHQRPKLEEYGDALFVVLRTASIRDIRIEVGETHIFVGPRYLISVRHGEAPSYADVRARCEAAPHLLRQGPGFALYALMDFIVDQYFPVADALEDRLQLLEESVFSGQSDRATIEQVYGLRRDLLVLKRAVSPLTDLCNRLTRFDSAIIHEDTQPYFRDVYDHVIRVNETVDTLRELIAGALDAKLSLVTVAQNEVTKKLAGWAAILAVPTMVAGVYGMNFQFMPELHWHYGYPLAMLGMAAISGTLHWRFRRAGWL